MSAQLTVSLPRGAHRACHKLWKARGPGPRHTNGLHDCEQLNAFMRVRHGRELSHYRLKFADNFRHLALGP